MVELHLAGAHDHVALGIGLAHVEQRIPGAEVGPPELCGHHPAFVGALHHGIVDRLGGSLGEGLRVEKHGRSGLPGLGHGLLGGGGHRGLEACHLREQQLGREEEVAAVPQQALGDVLQRLLRIGLLDEGRYLLHRADALAAGADIAVVDLRFRRRNAEGHDAAFLYGGETVAAALAELFRADHQMIRRQRQHGLGAKVARVDGGRRHRGAGVPARGLDQNVDLHADVPGLLLGHEAISVVGGDHRLGEQAAVGDPLERLLEGRLLAQQGHELLRHALARERPQALAGASDQDNGSDLRHSYLSLRTGPHVGPRYSRR